jgi:hypothetical protein
MATATDATKIIVLLIIFVLPVFIDFSFLLLEQRLPEPVNHVCRTVDGDAIAMMQSR